MRRVLTLVVRAALVIVGVAAVRALLVARTPQRALHGTDPVIGSFDTWPSVPRRTAG